MAGKYQVDGLDGKDVYEYNGCIFHGCPTCTDPDDYVPGSRKRMKDAYQQFQDKRIDLESRGYTVHEMWSCQWRIRKQDPDVAPFIEKLNLKKPLDIKEAFKGGRTNAVKLKHDVTGDEKIHHIDIVSLYPTVNKHEAYPVGHPEIIVSDFKDAREYFGVMKCIVKPRLATHFLSCE